MVMFNGIFDGKQVVLEKVPEGLAPNTHVRVIVVEEGKPFAFEAIAAMAIKGGLPSDFAAQHQHYVDSLPKR